MKFVKKILPALLLALATGTVIADDNSGWQFSVTPYLWFTSIEGELTSGGDTTIQPDEILNDLEFGLLLGGEVRKGKILGAADFVFLKMSDSDTIDIPGGPSGVDADLDLESWVVNLFGGYNLADSDRLLLDAVAGARYLYMGMDLNLTGIGSGSDSANVWNGVIGARGMAKLGKGFFIPYHFDIGAGDSDLTWQALLGLGYNLSNINFMLAYQHLTFDQGNDAIDELTISGPALGVEIMF